jgi:putative membrane protein
MDETPITHPGVPEEVYHTMGKKTFWIFFLERAHAAFILLLLAIVLFVVAQQSFLATIQQVPSLPSYVTMAAWIGLGLFAVVLAITLFIAWLVYSTYKFCLGDDSLKIKRGILNKEEVAIPYRQIQDVDLKRDLSFQMMGLSRIVIITAGHEEDEKPGDDDTEGILPALDKDLAEWMQAELLKRANVQKVSEESSS